MSSFSSVEVNSINRSQVMATLNAIGTLSAGMVFGLSSTTQTVFVPLIQGPSMPSTSILVMWDRLQASLNRRIKPLSVISACAFIAAWFAGAQVDNGMTVIKPPQSNSRYVTLLAAALSASIVPYISRYLNPTAQSFKQEALDEPTDNDDAKLKSGIREWSRISGFQTFASGASFLIGAYSLLKRR